MTPLGIFLRNGFIGSPMIGRGYSWIFKGKGIDISQSKNLPSPDNRAMPCQNLQFFFRGNPACRMGARPSKKIHSDPIQQSPAANADDQLQILFLVFELQKQFFQIVFAEKAEDLVGDQDIELNRSPI